MISGSARSIVFNVASVTLAALPRMGRRYARRVEMEEIEANDFNLNIPRYVSTAKQEVASDLSATHRELVDIEKQIQESAAKHNAFLKELGLSSLPVPDK
jgi:type I restriction enzyme M protein